MALNNCLLMVSERVFFKTHKLKAFTLAEVLITLVIIGVIAAMTISTLMNNTNNQELVSRLKKLIRNFHRQQTELLPMKGLHKVILGVGQLLQKRFIICIKNI